MLEMPCENEMASCVRGYHIYKDIWAAAIIRCKNYHCKIIFAKKIRTFSVYENVFTTKKVNYVIYLISYSLVL